MCATPPLREDLGVEVIGFVALFLMAFVMLVRDSHESD